MAPVYKSSEKDSDSGSESGSESEGNESVASGSSSDVSTKSKGDHSNQGSERSKSRSPSPANSRGFVSPGRRSRRDSGSSISADGRSDSARSLDRNAGDEHFETHDTKSVRSNASGSRSPSPGSQKSGSASPERDAESQLSRSVSPAEKSNASGKNSDRSRSPSPVSHSERKNTSRSRSPSEGSRQSSGRSRSPSVESECDKKSRKQSHSPMSTHSDQKQNDEHSSRENSRRGSQSSHRSQSSSKNRSGSEANSVKDSPRKSASPDAKSRSSSPHSGRKGGQSRQSRSQSTESLPKENEDSDAKRAVSHGEREQSHSGESDGGQNVNEGLKKRKRAVLSDDSASDDGSAKKKIVSDENRDEGEESMDKELVIDAEELFGNASDISSEDEGGNKTEKSAKVSELKEDDEKENDEDEEESENEKSKVADRDNDDDDLDRDEDKENEPEEQQLETRIDVEVPKITMNLGKELHFVKLPNFLSVETRPFYKNNYEDEIDEEETLDEEGRARLKLKVENTIRWREVAGKDGELIKQSNARFVRWSDGSMSLHLGSEIFDVYKQSLHGDHNHLFIRQGTGLQGQALFRTKLTFRPHSTESFTHRKMTMSLADRSQKTTGIKVLSLVGKDPEAHRGELIKKEEERLRASLRRASKQKRVREKAANRGLSASYLEPDRYMDVESDDEVISINAIKKQHQNKLTTRKGERPHIYSSDEEGSDIETIRARRLDKAKALKDSDSEEGSAGGGGAAAGGNANETRGGSSSRED